MSAPRSNKSWADQTEEDEHDQQHHSQHAQQPTRGTRGGRHTQGDYRQDDDYNRGSYGRDSRGRYSQSHNDYRNDRNDRNDRHGGGGGGGGYDRTNEQWERGHQVPDRRGGRGGHHDRDRDRDRERDRPQQQRRKGNTTESSHRETGVVASIKDNFGFIKCADREAQLFFHMTELSHGHSNPQKGDELSFVVVTDHDQNREYAGNIEILPKGSIAFEEVIQTKCKGVIEREMLGQTKRGGRGSSFRSNQHQEAYGGKIRLIEDGIFSEQEQKRKDAKKEADQASGTETPAPSSIYEFAERDVIHPEIALQLGDEVEFSIFIEKRSQRRGATAIALLRPSPAGRARGKVTSVKDSFGFLRPENERDDIFFHFSEMVDLKHKPAVDDELEYKPMVTDGKTSATRITVLPKGTILTEEISKESYRGEIISPLTVDTSKDEKEENPLTRYDGKKSRTTGLVGGQVRAVIKTKDGSEETVTLPFTGADTKNPKAVFLKGDIVTFHLVTKGSSRRATSLSLVTATTTGREQGIVCLVKEGFAFVDCVARTERIFLHASQLKGWDEHIKQGLEIEFNVAHESENKESAIRASILPKGTVSFDELSPDTYQGVITKESTRKDSFYNKRDAPNSSGKGERGEIRITSENKPPISSSSSDSESKSDLVTFSHNDIYSQRDVLNVGDTVSFRISVHKRTGRRSAKEIKLISMDTSKREKGIVTWVGDGSARILYAGKLNPISLQLSEILDRDHQIAVDDCVEFNASKSEHNKTIATRVRLLPKGSVSIETQSSTRVRGTVKSLPLSITAAAAQPTKGTKRGIIVLDEPSSSSTSATPASEEKKSQPKSSDPHPASLDTLIAHGDYKSEIHHPAAIRERKTYTKPSKTKKSTTTTSHDQHTATFAFHDLHGKTALSKGDYVEFILATRVADPTVKRALDITMVPKQAIVIQASKQGGILRSPTDPNAPHYETFSYVPKDVAAGADLWVKDIVEFVDTLYDMKSRTRQAIGIKVIKEGDRTTAPTDNSKKEEVKEKDSKHTKTTRPRATTAATTAPSQGTIQPARYAKGPDEDGGKGFTERKRKDPNAVAPTPVSNKFAALGLDDEE